MFLTFISKYKPALDNKPHITLSNAEHNRSPVAKIVFGFNQSVINKLKETISAGRRSPQKCRYITRDEFNLNILF
jgi:hypothetical protein